MPTAKEARLMAATVKGISRRATFDHLIRHVHKLIEEAAKQGFTSIWNPMATRPCPCSESDVSSVMADLEADGFVIARKIDPIKFDVHWGAK